MNSKQKSSFSRVLIRDKPRSVFSRKIREELKSAKRKQRVAWFNERQRVLKNYDRIKTFDFTKLLPGDVILSTPVSKAHLSSGVIRWALNSPYSHTMIYVRRVGNRHIVKDFKFEWKKMFKGANREFVLQEHLLKQPSNLLAIRFIGSSDTKTRQEQIAAFLENANRIKGGYDFGKAIHYGLHRLSGGRIKNIDMRGDTCSEFVAEAAMPTKEEIDLKERVSISPPLIPKTVDRESIHPGTIYEAHKKGDWFMVTPVTEEKWVKKKK